VTDVKNPPCIGRYRVPTEPNDCDNCPASELCRQVVAKSRLDELLERVEKVQSILRGTDRE